MQHYQYEVMPILAILLAVVVLIAISPGLISLIRSLKSELVRSEDKWVTGTIGGIAEYLQVEPLAARIIYAIGLAIGPFQAELFATYIILAIIIPEESYYN